MDFKNKYLKYNFKYNLIGGIVYNITKSSGETVKVKCPFKNGDTVIINGLSFKDDGNYESDSREYIGKFGKINKISFLPTKEGNTYRMCNMAEVTINSGIVKRYNVTNLLYLFGNRDIPDDIITKITLNNEMSDVINIYKAYPDIRKSIQDYKYNFFYDKPLDYMYSLKDFRDMFKSAIGVNINRRSDITDVDFQYLRGIHFLQMSECIRITDAALEYLSDIHLLNISSCSGITGVGFVYLHGIKTLDMSNCVSIMDDVLQYLGSINTLVMRDCELITGNGFSHLRDIRLLDISNCYNILGSSFRHLAGIDTLIMDSIYHIRNHNISNDDFRHLSKIRYLSAVSNPIINDGMFQHIKSVKNLDISGCINITDAAFVHLENVRTLIMNFSGYPYINFTNAAFTNLKNIIELDITGCYNITDDAFLHINLTLERLKMTSCKNITNSAFSGLTNIKELIIDNCTQEGITDDLFRILDDKQHLEYLSIVGCTQLTRATAEAFATRKRIYINYEN